MLTKTISERGRSNGRITAAATKYFTSIHDQSFYESTYVFHETIGYERSTAAATKYYTMKVSMDSMKKSPMRRKLIKQFPIPLSYKKLACVLIIIVVDVEMCFY